MIATETRKGRFKVLGVNDDESFCECCGKAGLQRVVWIEDTETGKISHFGTTCAVNPAKAFGLKAEIKQAVTSWENTLRIRYAVAFKKYRAAGGKYVSNGIPLWEKGGALIPADKPLYDRCLAETIKSEKI